MYGTLCIVPHHGDFSCGLTDAKEDARKTSSDKACQGKGAMVTACKWCMRW